MDKIQINELRTLIDMQYPHICLSQSDLTQFLHIPWEDKRFYKLKVSGQWRDKKGFFHNGKTTVWASGNLIWVAGDHRIMPNHIRIADKEIPTAPGGANWSHDFSFEKEGSANRIMRMMKMKAFW